MNARQKAKICKKKLDKLYGEYVNAVMEAQEAYNKAEDMVEDILNSHAPCIVTRCFDGPVEITDEIFEQMMARMCDLYSNFKEAVVFEGHTDLDTGKYILIAKLTVVMPEVEEDYEDIM